MSRRVGDGVAGAVGVSNSIEPGPGGARKQNRMQTDCAVQTIRGIVVVGFEQKTGSRPGVIRLRIGVKAALVETIGPLEEGSEEEEEEEEEDGSAT